jgi:hypothetical protein
MQIHCNNVASGLITDDDNEDYELQINVEEIDGKQNKKGLI